jgi:hypothetical protein
MIRTANLKDIPEIVDLIKSEPGFWDETWKGSVAFYYSIRWSKPDVVLMRKIMT